ncbi:MAG: hypothetical protein AAGF24_05725 [Cyanobacteria bacterium P01_H01_bin.121]
MALSSRQPFYRLKDGSKYWIIRNLLRRGWKREDITAKLGEPDKYLPIGGVGGTVTWGKGYRCDRVLEAERQAKASQTKPPLMQLLECN